MKKEVRDYLDKQIKVIYVQVNYIFYILPKIHTRLKNILSNCSTSAERASEFLDNHLKSVMLVGSSNIKNAGNFLNKIQKQKRKCPKMLF